MTVMADQQVRFGRFSRVKTSFAPTWTRLFGDAHVELSRSE